MATATVLLTAADPRAGALLDRADDGAPRHPAAGTLPGPAVGLIGLGRLGAGLVAVASGADHLRHAGGAPWGGTLVALGLVAGTWGLVDLRRRRAPGRRAAVALAVAGATWATAATSGLLPGPGGLAHAAGAADASLVALLLLTAAVAAAGVRADRSTSPVAGPTRAVLATDLARPGHQRRCLSTVPRLAAWAGGALLVAGLTAAGLASTEAGRSAAPHGTHGPPAAPAVPPAPLPASGHGSH